MWITIGGGVAWTAAFAAIGVGVGALIRSAAAGKAMLSETLLPRWGGGLTLALYTIAFAALALTTSLRRDVS